MNNFNSTPRNEHSKLVKFTGQKFHESSKSIRKTHTILWCTIFALVLTTKSTLKSSNKVCTTLVDLWLSTTTNTITGTTNQSSTFLPTQHVLQHIADSPMCWQLIVRTSYCLLPALVPYSTHRYTKREKTNDRTGASFANSILRPRPTSLSIKIVLCQTRIKLTPPPPKFHIKIYKTYFYLYYSFLVNQYTSVNDKF